MTSYLQRLHFGTFANNPRTRSTANTHTRKVFVVLRTFYKTEVSNRLTSVHSLSVCTSGCLSIALGHHTRLVCHSYHQSRSAPNREQISKKNNAYQVAVDKHFISPPRACGLRHDGNRRYSESSNCDLLLQQHTTPENQSQ